MQRKNEPEPDSHMRRSTTCESAKADAKKVGNTPTGPRWGEEWEVEIRLQLAKIHAASAPSLTSINFAKMMHERNFP